MTYRRLFLLIFIPGLLLASDKTPKLPPAPPSVEQMWAAYTAVVRQLTDNAKNPRSIEVDPIERAKFVRKVTKKGEQIYTMVGFYGQNSYGATLRFSATCISDGDGSRTYCVE